MSERMLEEVLADHREEAQVLRRNGHTREADQIDRRTDEVARAAERFLTWLSEPEAMLQSGKSLAWLRGRFPEWERTGEARRDRKGRRVYLQVAVPPRAHPGAARAQGRSA